MWPQSDSASGSKRSSVEREPAQPLGLAVVAVGVGRFAPVEALAVAGRGQRIGRRIGGIERDGALEQRQRLLGLAVLEAVEQVEPAQHAFVGVEALGMLAQHALQLRFLHLGRDRRHHPGRELVLQRKEILGLAREAVAPDRPAAFAVAQLGRQPHLAAGPPHAARQHVAHVELAADGGRIGHRRRDSAAPRRARSRSARAGTRGRR